VTWIGRPDIPLSGDVKRHILTQFDHVAERFAAIHS
jgi:hypothetical protein